MSYEKVKASGITSDTPKNITMGAGTIHKGLEFNITLTEDTQVDASKTYYTRSGSEGSYVYTAVASPTSSALSTYYEAYWNFSTSLIGATSGGNKLTITPELKDIDVDGATVKVKGLTVKTGETAKLETNIAELTGEFLKMAIIGQSGDSSVLGYDAIESKANIETGDYITNFGYISTKLDGSLFVVIFDNALCTSGLELDGKNKEAGVCPATFECYADLSADANKLPYHMYTLTPAA